MFQTGFKYFQILVALLTKFLNENLKCCQIESITTPAISNNSFHPILIDIHKFTIAEKF